MPCGCVRADGLEEPDVSRVIEETPSERDRAIPLQVFSKKRATVLMNISRTYSGLASQLEILAGDKAEMAEM
jgi:hypothetical protein